MTKVTFFDVEYANSKNKSLCQIGLLSLDIETGKKVYPDINTLIDPQDGFDNHCVSVHGIGPSSVAKAPAFDELWPEIEKYFTNGIIVGHNVASADLDALVKNLSRYNIDIPELYYICTYEMAQRIVPAYAIENYKQSTLCNYYGIENPKSHDAYYDAKSCMELFYALCEETENLRGFIHKYQRGECKQFDEYASMPVINKAIAEYYGMIEGFVGDGVVDLDEREFIKEWTKSHSNHSNIPEVHEILDISKQILSDGKIEVEDIERLQRIIRSYLQNVSSSPITLATQMLAGILKGIAFDGIVTKEELISLREWVYDNAFLEGHYPFNKIAESIEQVLADGIVSPEESKELISYIDELLNPVDNLKDEINTVCGKHVVLSGNFAHGSKSEVENFIVNKGGIIDKGVTKKTDILIVGDFECQSYSNGSYGTKVKKAMEYNDKGLNIQIIKEKDFYSQV